MNKQRSEKIIIARKFVPWGKFIDLSLRHDWQLSMTEDNLHQALLSFISEGLPKDLFNSSSVTNLQGDSHEPSEPRSILKIWGSIREAQKESDTAVDNNEEESSDTSIKLLFQLGSRFKSITPDFKIESTLSLAKDNSLPDFINPTNLTQLEGCKLHAIEFTLEAFGSTLLSNILKTPPIVLERLKLKVDDKGVYFSLKSEGWRSEIKAFRNLSVLKLLYQWLRKNFNLAQNEILLLDQIS